MYLTTQDTGTDLQSPDMKRMREFWSNRYCNGVMGVPITFLDKYNPEQYSIIALGNSRDNFTPNKDYMNPKKHLRNGQITHGGAINCVLAIEQNTIPYNTVYYTSDNSRYLVPPYARILISKIIGV